MGWRWRCQPKKTGKVIETDEKYTARIRKEAREKILKNSKPIDVEAVRRSMAIDEPTHLGNLNNSKNTK